MLEVGVPTKHTNCTNERDSPRPSFEDCRTVTVVLAPSSIFPFVYFVCFVGLSSFREIPLCFWLWLRCAGCFVVCLSEIGLIRNVRQAVMLSRRGEK